MPVITLVVYWSPNEWDGPLSLHEMFSVQDRAVLSLVPDYKINLIAPSMINDEDFKKFSTTLAEALQYIKYSGDKTTLEKVINANDKFQALDRRTAEVINAVTSSKLKIKESEAVNMCVAIEEMKKEAVEKALANQCVAIEEMKKEAVEKALANQCVALEEMKKEAVEKALAKAEEEKTEAVEKALAKAEEEKTEAVEKALAKAEEEKAEAVYTERKDALKSLMANLKLSAAQAMDALSIPENERAYYLQQL